MSELATIFVNGYVVVGLAMYSFIVTGFAGYWKGRADRCKETLSRYQ